MVTAKQIPELEERISELEKRIPELEKQNKGKKDVVLELKVKIKELKKEAKKVKFKFADTINICNRDCVLVKNDKTGQLMFDLQDEYVVNDDQFSFLSEHISGTFIITIEGKAIDGKTVKEKPTYSLKTISLVQ